MRKTISAETWEAVFAAWQAGDETIMEIALRLGVHYQSIRKRARRENWPPRSKGDGVDARVLYGRLTAALEDGLARLQGGADETPAQARERLALVRAHRKALETLIASQDELLPARPAGAGGSGFVTDGTMEWLQRLREWLLADPDHRCACGGGVTIEQDRTLPATAILAALSEARLEKFAERRG